MFDLGLGLKLDTTMSFRATALKRSPLALLFLVLGSFSAFGQRADSPLAFNNNDAITVSFVDAPVLGLTQTSSSDRKWLKIEFHYAVAPDAKKYGDFLPSAQFKIWVEGRDLLDPQGKPGQGIAVGLTQELTYVNIKRNRDVYGVFYIHPSTLERYSTANGVSDFDRTFDIHLEAYVEGTLMDAVDKNKETDPNWFKALKPISDLVYRQDQCVFLVIDPDRYPALKISNK